MNDIERYLGRGDKVRRETTEHPMGLARRLVRRVVQLAVLYAIARGVSHEALASLLEHSVVAELGVTPFVQPIPGHVVALCQLLAIVALAAAGLDALSWRATRYVLTDRRVLAIRGAMTRVVVDTPLEQITELALRQSPLGRKLGYGDLMLRTSADHADRPAMRAMADPIGFRQAIDRRREKAIAGEPTGEQAKVADSDVNATLRRLSSLRAEGLVTPEEYETRRQALLQQL